MSNRLDCLADALVDRFLDTRELRTIIITPSNTLKDFILQHFTQRLGYFFGVRILSLPQAVEYFAKLCRNKNFKSPEHLSLMLHIESEIRRCKSPELLDYLEGDEEKIFSLAEEMSHVFLHYGLYGYKALKDWEKQEGWQQEIWRRLSDFWDFPHEVLSINATPRIPHAVHLFDLTHIPLLYSSFLNHLSEFWPVYTYFRSPTPLYWGDLLSERALTPELKSFELETNSHLANLGGIGKRYYSFLAERDFDENYIPHVRDSFLNSIKQDIFDLTITEYPPDDTVEIHSAPTKMREVEVLLENLEKSGCEDVLVLAPNINDYFPYIQFVFEKEECPFGYLATDLILPTHRILDRFFSLVESRFEPKLILEVLSSPQFKIKEDLSLLNKITERVRWGYNQEMRENILEREGVSDIGTWEACFQSLLRKLAYASSPIELSKAENFGNLIALLEGLYSDLWSLNKKKAPLNDWLKTIEALLEKYFLYSDEMKNFLTELHSCSQIEGEFSYPSIRRVIREILSQQKESRALLSKPAVRFASLKEGVVADADVICLLGMDEDSFPRKNTFRSINQLKYSKNADHQPENTEKDRYLLLQALVSARKRLLFSYVNVSPKDGKEVGVSLLIEKLCPIQEHTASVRERLRLRDRFPNISQTQTVTFTFTEISISALAKLARDPVQFYCNEALGIYLDKQKSDNEFLLSYQQKAELRYEALFQPVEMPDVLFQDTAKQELESEVEELQTNLTTLDLRPKDFYSLRFDLACQKPTTLADGTRIYPAIQVEDVWIHGELTRLTPKGLFTFGKNSFSEWWKFLPHLLIMSKMDLPLTLLFGKDATTKSFAFSKDAFPHYIQYYRDALKSASTLLPDQAEKLYKGKKAGEPSSYFENPYLEFIKPTHSDHWEKHFGILCKNLSL